MTDIVTDNEQSLFEENSMLKKKIEKLKQDVKEARPYVSVKIERYAVVLSGVFVLAAMLLGGILWDWLVLPPSPPEPPNAVVFCYPLASDGSFKLYGNRLRGYDIEMSKHNSMTELVETARVVGCPMLRPVEGEKK